MALWLARGGRIRAQTLTLSGRFSRSLSSATSDQIKPTDLNQITRSTSAEKSDDEIKRLASYATARVDESIKSATVFPPLIFGAEIYVNTDLEFKDYCEISRLSIMLRVADLIQDLPQVDKIQIYHAKIYYESMLFDQYKDDLTKREISNTVLSVIQKFPKIGDNKVTEETHFFKDLGFDKWDLVDIIQALQMSFKLYIPYEIVSCKLAIKYIYDHRLERLSREEFRKHLYITGDFRGSKSEFRRFFVPGLEKRKIGIKSEERMKIGIKSDRDCRALSYNGFEPYKFFRNMKLWFYCDL